MLASIIVLTMAKPLLAIVQEVRTPASGATIPCREQTLSPKNEASKTK
jgi:hypothetical protein